MGRPKLFDEERERFLLRLAPTLFDDLSALAAKRAVSLNSLIVTALEELFARAPERQLVVDERPQFRRRRTRLRASNKRWS
jgi:hypothetical protein